MWHDLGVIDYHLAHFDGAVEVACSARWIWTRTRCSPCSGSETLCIIAAISRRRPTAFGKLIDRYPSFTIARFHLGVIYARQGEKEKAEDEFRRVLMKNPEDAAARFYVSR